MANTIKLKKYSDIVEEYKALGTITPGMLVELKPTGIQVHSVAGGNVYPMVATEDSFQGKGIDDKYVITDQVQCWITGRGDVWNALLEDGENVVIGDWLESAGNGKVRKHVADVVDESWAASSKQTGNTIDLTVLPLAIIGQALKAVNMSGTSHADPDGRIPVRVI